ncbi:hypothetical protein HJC23_003601 [Cyclotella cryptica]|uniref:Helicase-associated domain-containing protein n=1 Tax=Cyclotella cryptica TaxID=29204 RepID=A0ABD3QIV5_9STRA
MLFKGASVPQSIYLKSDETFTPSPEAAPHNESLMEAAYMAHPSEPPPLPTYHHADSHKSDFGNSSSNSSGHTETCGETGWMKNYNSLIQYWKKNGDCNVPQKYQDENKINLGVWVNKQRMERRKLERNKTSSLSPMRLAKLDALGFNWGKEKGQASWDAKYKEICAFKRKHGHCNVKTKDKENPALGRWVTSQRADYKNDRLGEDKIDKLNAIGFCWEVFKQEK